jgi:MoxR-like ATPase
VARTFSSLDDVDKSLAAVGYLADKKSLTAVLLCAQLEKPLLVEGPAGVGKTELARAMAQAQDRKLIRLQCYEGIDETRALYEWEYTKQLLYTQLLKDRIHAVVDAHATLDDAVAALSGLETLFFSEKFLVARPLLQAIRSPEPCVLLVDEIDKADPELEALLLEVLADAAVTIPEIGTIRATSIPQVVLTSNAARELSEPLRRRCLHLTIGFPDRERELHIVRARVPGVDESLARAVVAAVEKIRTLELKKPPSISETLDWTRALGLVGKGFLDEGSLKATLGVLLKHQEDEELVEKKRVEIVAAAHTTQV